MRTLLTGHNGYIGTVLTRLLVEQGHEVTGLDTDYFSRCRFVGRMPEIDAVQTDIRDLGNVDLHAFDAVIHLAGLSNDPLGDYRPELTDLINTEASIELAKRAKDAGVQRFLFASSCSNYGAAGDDFLDEQAEFNPVTPYAASKVRVETALRALADETFSPTYLRASTAYGVSPLLRFDLVINNLVAWAFTTGQVYLKSDGTPWRPVVHVEDIARAYVAVLNAPRELIHDEPFNVGSTAENYQVRDLAEIVREVVPNCKLEYAPGAGADARCYRVDCNKIARTLHDFKPQWTARRGIEELYRCYKDAGLTKDDFESARFMRIAHIRKLVDDGLLDDELKWRDRTE